MPSLLFTIRTAISEFTSLQKRCTLMKKRTRKIIFSVVPLLLLTVLLAACNSGGSSTQVIPGSGGTATLSWNAPTLNTDGTALSSLAGFRLYYGLASKAYSHMIDVHDMTSYSVSSLPTGTYYFAVTCYDSSGMESDFSNEVTKFVL